MVLAVLDKAYPPSHSFVDGMLADAFPRLTGERVVIVVARDPAHPRVIRYGRSICLNVLPRRRGLGRLSGAMAVFCLVRMLAARSRGRRPLRVLVRNEPAYLAGAIAARSRRDRLVYQSSFPHEQGPWYSAKHTIAKLLLSVLVPRCDATLALTPLGAERLKRYAGSLPCHIIPLAGRVSTTEVPTADADREPADAGPALRLVYIGSHDRLRRLDVVYAGVSEACRRGVPLSVTSIGGSDRDVAALRESPDVRTLESAKVLRFLPVMARDSVLASLSRFDVGMSIIPPSAEYREASPTKLAEYMSAGLAVIASRGIPAQEDLVTDSGAGVVVDFDQESIGRGLCELASGVQAVTHMRLAARRYIESRYSYDRFVDVLDRALREVRP